ncbi:UNKNOWN [Stylonychia lemnae]|uniref:Uncharacterized protein n=1 Tax=Stylonychia lemnae TaxID=5949 RepID=A0A078AYL8_STYLE|nr:UNKNOWN [Stylonychia lemnae]|eukprot:CDW87520.1 UNKNOWN [Stylonychia lemnae]
MRKYIKIIGFAILGSSVLTKHKHVDKNENDDNVSTKVVDNTTTMLEGGIQMTKSKDRVEFIKNNHGNSKTLENFEFNNSGNGKTITITNNNIDFLEVQTQIYPIFISDFTIPIQNNLKLDQDIPLEDIVNNNRQHHHSSHHSHNNKEKHGQQNNQSKQSLNQVPNRASESERKTSCGDKNCSAHRLHKLIRENKQRYDLTDLTASDIQPIQIQDDIIYSNYYHSN